MKCSVIISVLDSHDFFQRQMRRFQEIMPGDFELIVMDAGSEKPLAFQEPTPFPFRLIATNDRRPWTSNMARSQGAKLAKGDYLLMTDIDRVLTREALAAVASFSDDMLTFERRTATGLDEAGALVVAKSDRLSPHCNTFAIRRDLFARTGYLEVYRAMAMTASSANATKSWCIRERFPQRNWDQLFSSSQVPLRGSTNFAARESLNTQTDSRITQCPERTDVPLSASMHHRNSE